MAVNPANMESCQPKAKCLNGPNEGVAYDRDSPCGGIANVVFNPVSCDCEETILCVDSGECGFDIDWEIEAGANTIWSMKPCGASSCTIVCASDEYRECATYTANSGSVYLDPGKCLRVVKLLTDGPCPNDSPAPGGAYTRMDWYECNPGVTDPSYTTCSTPVAQMPGGGYCSTVMTGPGIVETGRVRRVKLTTSTLAQWNQATGGYATCDPQQCSGPTGSSANQISVNWLAPVDERTITSVAFSSTSDQCAGGGPCPGTWQSHIGVDWITYGTGSWSDASSTTASCGVSDGLAIVGTAGISQNGVQKGEKMGQILSAGWSGAHVCTFQGSSTLTGASTTAYNCYKPSDLV